MDNLNHLLDAEILDWGVRITFKPGAVLEDSNFIEYVKSVTKFVHQHNKKKVLIDAHKVERKVSSYKLFQSGDLLVEMETVGFKVAIVAPHLFNNDSNFFRNIGSVRGIYIEYFPDEESAMKWLVPNEI